jgi:hypothetical protein
VCVLPHFLKIINLQVALALFVVLQIPTIFFESRAVQAGPPPLDAGKQEASSSPAMQKDKPVRQAGQLDGFEFAVYIVLIAGLWHVLHLLRGDVGGGAMSWALDSALDAGALFLCLLWMISVKGRLRDAGLLRWAVDFCLIVFTTSLLPLAFRIISFPQALVIFAALQIPAIFIRRGSISSRLHPVDADF